MIVLFVGSLQDIRRASQEEAFRYSQHYLRYISAIRVHRPGLFFIPIFPVLLTIYPSYSSSSTRFIFYSDICPALLAMYVHFSNPSTGFIYFFPYISNVAIYLTSTRFIFIINRVSWKS